jgi:hypothetical protein
LDYISSSTGSRDAGDALHHILAGATWQGGEPANICDKHTELVQHQKNALLTNIADAD